MEILYIILGWLLGTLSPGITDRISNHYKKIELKRIITSELRDLRNRLALLPFKVRSDYRTLDKEFVIWMKTQVQDFLETEPHSSIKDALAKLDTENENSLTKVLNLWNSSRKRENPSFHFKKVITSIIDANLINIGLIDNKFLTKLLDIKFQINALNEEIEAVSERLTMTFDSSISVTNHQIIQKIIEDKNLIICEKALLIVEKINHILKSEN